MSIESVFVLWHGLDRIHALWVAHPVLKGPEAQNIVRQFDKYQELTEAMKNAAHGQQLTVDVSQGLQYG